MTIIVINYSDTLVSGVLISWYFYFHAKLAQIHISLPPKVSLFTRARFILGGFYLFVIIMI